jgi:phage terminase large subunit-like protein
MRQKKKARRTPAPSTSRRRARAADRTTEYARAVVSGDIVAGPHVRNACRRHLDDLEHASERGYEWNVVTPRERERAKKDGRPPERSADWALGFFENVLKLNGGKFENVSFALHPSQAFIIGSVFGWTRKSDGMRRFRRVYIEQGKGNGKSPLAAGIGLLCMLADGESRAEVYAAASKKDQAMVLFRDAVAMVDLSPALSKRIVKSGGNPVWNLADHRTGSFFRPISSDDGKSGPRPSCALCDEVHEHHDGGNTIDMLERGFKSREQPLLFMITNSGSDRTTVCWNEHEWAVKVAAGTSSPDEEFSYVGEILDGGDQQFSYVCAMDSGDDPFEDESCWIKANPLLDVIVKRETLRAAVSQAKSIAGKANGILRLHFCQWTDADTAWITRPALERVLADFDPMIHVGKEVCAAVDLSGSRDMSALAAVVKTGFVEVPRDDGQIVQLPTYDAWLEVWTPGDTVDERELRDRAPYRAWVKAGHLHAEPGQMIRLDFIAAKIAELNSYFSLRMLGYDRYAYKRLEDELGNIGVSIDQIEHPQGGVRRGKAPAHWIEDARLQREEPPQGLWMPASVNALENLILEGRIRIRSSPVVIAACMSAAVERDAFDNRWFSKRKATNRIDPLVALTMAVGVAEMAPAKVEASVGVSVW